MKHRHPTSSKQTLIFNQQKKVFCFQKVANKCKEFVRIGGEQFDLMVQLQRKQCTSPFPGLGYRNVCIFSTELRYSSSVYQ